MSRVSWRVCVWGLAAGCEPALVFDGPPTIEVGTGEFAYEVVEPGQALEIVHGSQGGDHVWAGVRITEMDPRQVRLDTTTAFIETGEQASPALFFYANLFEGPSGDLEYAGLTVQLNPKRVEDQLIRVVVTATDRGGRTATSSMDVVPFEP